MAHGQGRVVTVVGLTDDGLDTRVVRALVEDDQRTRPDRTRHFEGEVVVVGVDQAGRVERARHGDRPPADDVLGAQIAQDDEDADAAAAIVVVAATDRQAAVDDDRA